MKTAISISDEVFLKAEKTALLMGLSRSKLYTKAIVDFVQNHNPDVVTERINAVYNAESSELDEDVHQANFDLISSEDW